MDPDPAVMGGAGDVFEPKPPPCDIENAFVDKNLLSELDTLKEDLDKLKTHKEKAEFGEKRMLEKLRKLGRVVLFGPGDKGWNQPGADAIVLDPNTGIVEFVDNKFLSDPRNISKADALLKAKNFDEADNIGRALRAIDEKVSDPKLAALARENIGGKRFVKVVSGFGGVATGITPRIAEVAKFMGDRDALEMKEKAARLAGKLELADKLAAAIDILGKAAVLYGLLMACNTARAEGIEAGAVEFARDQSVIFAASELAIDAKFAADPMIKNWMDDKARVLRIERAKKLLNKKWLSEASGPERTDALSEVRGLSEEDFLADKLREREELWTGR